MKKENDTIYALSTPAGKSAIAVIRISGSNAHKVLKKISVNKLKTSNQSFLNTIKTADGTEVDKTITTLYKKPKSFTGENMAEISCHGGTAVINKIMGLLSQIKGIRIAEKGEFTRRAFENNKLDLTQVEAISDIINSETEAQRRQAYSQLEGSLSNKSKEIYEEIKLVLANTEAIIDFSDEDLPPNIYNKIKEQIKNIIKKIDKILKGYDNGIKIRNGFIVAIIGETNTGKSSFLNHISDQDIAIVTDTPGTTRDALESYIDISGIPVRFFDTAGIRKSPNKIEKIGIDKGIKISEQADLNLIFIERLKDIENFKYTKNPIFIQSKLDKRKNPIKKSKIINISSFNGLGIKKLLRIVFNKLKKSNRPESVFVSRERHKKCLEKSKQFLLMAQKNRNYDFMSEDIRQSLREISKIYGKVDIEDILGIIFNDFCIGK